MKLGSRILTGSFVKTADTVVHGGVAFLMLPFIVHTLGPRIFGFWAMVSTFIGYYGFFDLGLSIAVSRYISRAIGQSDDREMNDIVNTALVLFSIIGAAVLLLSVGIAAFCPLFMENPVEIALFRKVLLIAGLSMSLDFPLRVFSGIMTSHFRYDIIYLLSILRVITANLLIYVLLKNGHGILTLTAVTALAKLAENLIRMSITRRMFPRIRIDLHRFHGHKTRSLFSYSWKAFVAQLADTARFKVDSFVIAGFLSLNLVTVYNVAQRILEYTNDLLQSSINVMVPVFSQYEGRNDYANIRAKFMTISKISLALALFIGASTAFYGKAFIARWMGPEFGQSYAILLILFVPIAIETAQNPSIQLMYGLSKHHYYMLLNIGEGVANLVLSITLVHWIGIYGVALGTAIEIVVAKLFILPVLTCRMIAIELRQYYKTMGLSAVKLIVPLLAYFFLVRGLIRPDYALIVALGAGQALVIGPIAFLLILNREERQSLLHALRLRR